jgi:hypothetical protein
MIKRKYSTSLNRGVAAPEEDVNPNSYLTNIADCMLVLVLGLLVALVMRYGVELATPQDSTTGIQINMDVDDDGEIDGWYKESGTVYYDSSTGKYYMVKK